METKHPLRAYLEEKLRDKTRDNPIGVNLERGRATEGYSELTKLAHQAGNYVLERVAGQAALRSLARELKSGLNEEFILEAQAGSDRAVLSAIREFYAESGFTQTENLNKIPNTHKIGKSKQSRVRPLAFSKADTEITVWAVRTGNDIDISIEERNH